MVALRRSIEELKVHADRDALIVEADGWPRGRGWKKLRGEQHRQRRHQGKDPTQARLNLLCLAQLQPSRDPQNKRIKTNILGCGVAGLSHISSLGCRHVVKATANPVMIGDKKMSQQELERQQTSQEIKDARFVYGLLMESMTGCSIAGFRVQKATSPSGAWEELEKHNMPKTLAATQRLKREFATMRMVEGEDPLLFLGRVDKAADQLALLGCSKSVEEVNQHL